MKYNSFYTYYPDVVGHTKVHKNAYRGNLKRLHKNISDGLSIYVHTSDRQETPLFLAVSNDKIDVANALLDIYESDLRFIDDSLQWCSSQFWHQIPILIGLGDSEIERIQILYKDYKGVEGSEIDSAKCSIILLKRDNCTPVQVICLSPQTDRGKQIALIMINALIKNGRLDLNVHTTKKNSLLYAAIATGLVTIFNRLCDLGAQQDAVKLFLASIHLGRMDILEMLYKRYTVKMCDVIGNETFFDLVFASEEPEIYRFVFEKYLEQNEHLTWNFVVNLQPKPSEKSVFGQAITHHRFEFAEFCLQHKPDLFKADSQGCLPAHYISASVVRAKSFMMKMIEMDPNLVEYKIPNRNGITVLHQIVQSNWIDVILEIFDKYPSAKKSFFQYPGNVLSQFETLLHFKYYEMAEILIIHGKSHLEDTNTIISILNCAIRKNRIDLVKSVFNEFGPILNGRTSNIAKSIFTALSHYHLHIYKFIIGQINFDLQTIINEDGLNLLHFAIWQKIPRYADDMPGSLWDSLYRIPNDSEDEEDQKLGLLPKFERPDENYPDPFEITDDDIAENEKFDQFFDELIEYGVDFKHRCPLSNNTLLHQAVETNNMYATKRLLELGVDLNAYNNAGDQPIHCATNIEIFQLLNSWTAKSFINSKNCVTRKTPLHKSVQLESTKIELTRYILKNDGDVKAIDNEGRTPIFEVFNVEYAKLLLAHQVHDINMKDINGNTVIHGAFLNHNLELLILLFAQPNINYCALNNSGTSYLEHFASYQLTREKRNQAFQNVFTLDNPNFKQLLEVHCNTKTANGTTVIGTHNVQYDEFMIDMLLKQPHLDLNVQDNQTGNSPLHKAAECGSANLFDKLIERGIPIDIVNNNNDTPLNLCCQYYQDIKIITNIMKHKPNVNIRNNSGMTAILNAAKISWNERVFTEILAAGGNIFDVDPEGNSAYSMISNELKQLFVFLT